jgi:hypothetical protein
MMLEIGNSQCLYVRHHWSVWELTRRVQRLPAVLVYDRV